METQEVQRLNKAHNTVGGTSRQKDGWKIRKKERNKQTKNKQTKEWTEEAQKLNEAHKTDGGKSRQKDSRKIRKKERNKQTNKEQANKRMDTEEAQKLNEAHKTDGGKSRQKDSRKEKKKERKKVMSVKVVSRTDIQCVWRRRKKERKNTAIDCLRHTNIPPRISWPPTKQGWHKRIP